MWLNAIYTGKVIPTAVLSGACFFSLLAVKWSLESLHCDGSSGCMLRLQWIPEFSEGPHRSLKASDPNLVYS